MKTKNEPKNPNIHISCPLLVDSQSAQIFAKSQGENSTAKLVQSSVQANNNNGENYLQKPSPPLGPPQLISPQS